MTAHKISTQLIRRIYDPVAPDAHKGTQGHALLIGGSFGKIGAIILASKAALHAGAGLVTAFIPKCGIDIIQITVPEVMVLTDKNKKTISGIGYGIIPQAIGIGPGMGQERETQNAFRQFLQHVKTPLVIDADGLNILSLNPDWHSMLPENTILTPHPKELERLIGKWDNDDERNEIAVAFSLKCKSIIVMKGAPTHIVNGGDIYENTTGNSALATAGSGDVLTGIITGLLAQGFSALNAALIGVNIHGLTADIALPHTGHRAFVASDIIANLGQAFLSIE